MKARIKATDRIIEVMCVMNIEGVAVWEDINGISTTPNQYTSDELEFLDFPEMPIATHSPDYWEKLKHQYAGMAMQGILSNNVIMNNIREIKEETMANIVTNFATNLAHALVEKLKEKEERK